MTTKPHFAKEYTQGPTAGSVDWVAGGNFDGYIHQKSLVFNSDKTVRIKTIILDQSRYDGNAQNSEKNGTFEYSDKDTITIEYDKFKMFGKILGKNNEFIVFSVRHPLADRGWNEVYKL